MLTRTKDGRIGGVCGGFAKYFDADPIWWRLGWALMTLATGVGVGILTYFVCWLVIPKEV
jgi:phage shock protein C